MEYKGHKINFPACLTPDNVQELIDRLDDTDNRAVGRKARKEEDRSEFSPGIIKAVKETIQEYNRANQGAGISAKDARAERILFEKDSSGKRTPRKWN